MTCPHTYYWVVLICLCLFPATIEAQDSLVVSGKQRPLRFSGQLSGWLQYTPDMRVDFSGCGRYIPQLNGKIPMKKEHLFDFEASANVYGSMNAELFSNADFDYKLKAYRIWARYSNQRMELRIGLQKINFGSAQMFRPLMWFDRIDSRDPLQLTDGVKALLWRYYFQNNANIWIWGLYGNNDLKGNELTAVRKNRPEAGGRIQLPIPKGEVALSYHYRTTDPEKLFFPWSPSPYEQIGEHKIGFDFKITAVAGFWLEASWTRLNKDLGIHTHQEMITAGTDYTFGIGNGLVATFEQSIFSYDQNAFEFAHNTTVSALSLLYSLNVFDHISLMTYRNWTDNTHYYFFTWEKRLNRLSFYVTGFWNPKTNSLPGQGSLNNRFADKGVHIMAVWNH